MPMEKDAGRCDAVLTYGWNRVAYAALRSLSHAGLKVAVGDVSRIAMGKQSNLCSQSFSYRSFYSDPRGFVSDLKSVLEKTSPKVYMPLHEETFVVAKYIHEFSGLKVKIPIKDFGSLARLHKKDSLMRMAESLSIPHPKTYTPRTVSELPNIWRDLKSEKVVIKSLNSNSAKGVFYASSCDELCSIYEKLVESQSLSPERFPLVQEYVRGEGYGVSMLYNLGSPRALFSHKRLREKTYSGGTSTNRVSVRNKLLESYAERLLTANSWHGLAMVEFKYDAATGAAWLIDVNPRFWGSIALAISAGVDFPLLLYRMAVDGDIAPVMDYKVGVTQRWLLGDMLGVMSSLKATRSFKPIRSLFDFADVKLDDFYWDDILPFFSQTFYYGSKLLSTRSLNPVADALLDVDAL